MAVFTPVSEEDVAGLLESYSIGGLRSLQPVAEGVENTNYRLETDTGVYALTLVEKRTPAESLPYSLGLSEHAARAGSPTPPLQRTRDGALLSTLAGRPTAIVGWLPGRWSLEPSPEAAFAAGRALAQFHAAAADYPQHRANPLGLSGWRALLERCAQRISFSEARLLADLAGEVSELASTWPSDLPKGAVHADYFPDNVLFSGGEVTGVIDLYFACTDALAYDLAIALNAWGFSNRGGVEPSRLIGFLAGYESLRPLSAAENAALPLLCRGAAVRFTLTRLHDRLFHDPTWAVTPKDPMAFFRRLEFHRRWQDRAELTGVSPRELLATPEPPPAPPRPPPRRYGSALAALAVL